MRWILIALVLLGAPEIAQAAPKVRAAVIEHLDRSTHATGAEELLRKAGAEVKLLDITRSPLEQNVDLIVFGSFCNTVRATRSWRNKYRQDLLAFMAQGGVILQMTQSDDREPTVPWLPDGVAVHRSDTDVNTVRLVAKKSHPLLAWVVWKKVGDIRHVKYQQPPKTPFSWEGLRRTEGVEVLLAADVEGTRPHMVVGEHGKGRFIITSLHIDKIWDKDGKPRVPKESITVSKAFFSTIVKYVTRVRTGKARPIEVTYQPMVGPMLGHVGEDQAYLWLRPKRTGMYTLSVRRADGFGTTIRLPAESLAENDRAITWHVGGLEPDTEYSYSIRGHGERLVENERLRTAPKQGEPRRVRLAFGSCASSDPDPVWDRMMRVGTQGIVLLGDTPYVDSTNLHVSRARHRAFLKVPGLAAAIRTTPLWSTWDDHDYGRNDADGTMRGKNTSRRVYREYRALRSYGHDGKGVYTSFRYGPIEVFLLDVRWFANTEKAASDPSAPSALGQRQRAWLLAGLRASTAPFKVLASGMVWGDKIGKAKDDWEHYKAERAALYAAIGAMNISGCVLISGDIHGCHYYERPRDQVGYTLHDFVISPLHGRLAGEEYRTERPEMKWSAYEPHVFLLLEADSTGATPRLTAKYIRRDGKELKTIRLRASDLRRPAEK